MARSQNGYTAGNENLLTVIEVAGGKFRVRKGPVAVIFQYLIQQFNDTVEPIKGPVLDDWSYAYRNVKQGTSLSNHASGTAVDLNALQHPLGRVGTFNSAQVRAIKRILDYLEGTIRWGGNYSGRKDEMHFEINANAARVTAVAEKIKDDEMALDPKEFARELAKVIPTADEIANATAKAIAAIPVGTGNEDSPGTFANSDYRKQSELMRLSDQVHNLAELLYYVYVNWCTLNKYPVSRQVEQAIDRMRARDVKHPGE